MAKKQAEKEGRTEEEIKKIKITKKQEQETKEPVFMFVSYGKGKRFRAPVGKKVALMHWDDKKQRVKTTDPRALLRVH